MQTPVVDREQRGFILLLALLQGAALYAMQLAREQQWPGLGTPAGQVLAYTLALAVPTVMALTVERLRDGLFWRQIAALSLGLVLLAAWAAFDLPEPGAGRGEPPDAYTARLAVLLFVLLPYLQARLRHRRWCAPYAELVDHGWHNGLSLLLLLPFVGFCWLVLWLWGALFDLLKIDLFSTLFRQTPFIYLATGTMVGLGLLLARTQRRPIEVLQPILFAVLRALLPLLAFISLLFLTMLPFTGLEPLWQTRRAAVLLLTIVALMVLCTNAVYGDGRPPLLTTSVYPRWVRRVVELSLVALPAYALLALYALWLRVDQHGWTPDRLHGALAALLLAAHALGYAAGLLRPRAAVALPALASVNVSLSWLAMAVLVGTLTPLLDANRISVASQMARLESRQIKVADLDLAFLRDRAGGAGRRALASLLRHPGVIADPALAQRIERLLQPAPAADAPPTRDTLRAQLAIAPGAGPVDDDWLDALVSQRLATLNCTESGSDCVVLTPDMDGDGRSERLLCALASDSAQCQLSARVAGQWQDIGAVPLHAIGGDVPQALRQGRYRVVAPQWSDLEIDGERHRLQLR